MKFIHTLSLIRFCEKDEIEAFKANYDKKAFFYDGDNDKKFWVLQLYKHFGLRIEIKPVPKKVKQWELNKTRYPFMMIIYITPAKLVNPGVNLGGLTDKVEIEKACKELETLVKVIEEKSDVNILSDTFLWRVDLTKDLLTPSDLYSQEIIKALKKSIKKYGYHLYNPRVHDDYVVHWHLEDSMMFKNENQHIGAKVYNKKRGLILDKCKDEVEQIGECGLLRFEISLLYKRLKDDYGAEEDMSCERLAEILLAVTNDATRIFDTYFSQVFFPGAMVSKEVMRALIKSEFPRKEKRLKKMLSYSDFVTGNRVKKEAKVLSDAQVAERRKHFSEINISPVSVCKECPYIPSVADLIEDRVDTKLLEFAEDKTAWHLDFLYWQQENLPT